MKEDLPIKLVNSAKYKGRDRWEWSVWIDGPATALDQIESVEYVLHPTFAQPVRRVQNRASRFQLDSRGWGEFMIHASITTRTGQTQKLDHWLRLTDDEHSAGVRVAAVEKPTLFLSYSRADSRIAEELRRFLEEKKGYEVLTDNQLNQDEPIARAIKSMISRTDALVALIPDELSSRWVLDEISAAIHQQIPVVTVLLGEEATLPPALADKQMLRVTNPRDSQAALDLVSKALEELNL